VQGLQKYTLVVMKLGRKMCCAFSSIVITYLRCHATVTFLLHEDKDGTKTKTGEIYTDSVSGVPQHLHRLKNFSKR